MSVAQVRFDPGTTCKELMLQVNKTVGLVDSGLTGMALYLGLLRRDEAGTDKNALPQRKSSVVGRSSVIDTVVKEVSVALCECVCMCVCVFGNVICVGM